MKNVRGIVDYKQDAKGINMTDHLQHIKQILTTTIRQHPRGYIDADERIEMVLRFIEGLDKC